jgi:hypothetical protein
MVSFQIKQPRRTWDMSSARRAPSRATLTLNTTLQPTDVQTLYHSGLIIFDTLRVYLSNIFDTLNRRLNESELSLPSGEQIDRHYLSML